MPTDAVKLKRLNKVLMLAWKENAFYRNKWMEAGLRPRRLEALAELASFPLVTHAELLADQQAHPPLGRNLSQPLQAFKHFHHSSGTLGQPILWADTARTWTWVVRCSQELFQLSGVMPEDRVMFIAGSGGSSGPKITQAGAMRLGCACLVCGHLEPVNFAAWLEQFSPTVLVGCPSRLCALAYEDQRTGRRFRNPALKKIILTGEGLPPTNREYLEKLFQARCHDRYGLTEAGSVAAGCALAQDGMHVLEEEFIVDCLEPHSGQPQAQGEPGELVLTNLGRSARPIIRYRTGDVVQLVRNQNCACGRTGAKILGEVDRLAGLNAPRQAVGA